MNPQGLYGYLISGSVPEPYTLIENVRCLGAGHFLHWSSGEIKQQQYWQINFVPEKISVQEAREKVSIALLDSIKHHFVSDVPVGIFLSSGIDSTTLLALASKTQTQPIRTYSIGFAESKWNEADTAKQIANLFGSDHTEYKITASEAKKLFPDFLAAIDQPTIDGLIPFVYPSSPIRMIQKWYFLDWVEMNYLLDINPLRPYHKWSLELSIHKRFLF